MQLYDSDHQTERLSTAELVDRIQEILDTTYDLDAVPSASDYIWNDSLQALSQFLGGKIRKNYTAATFSAITDGVMNSVIYLDPAITRNLAQASASDLFSSRIDDLLSVIEEVSHFTLNHAYFQLRGSAPSGEHAELQATVDRYLVTQHLAVTLLRRTLTEQEQQAVFAANVAFHEPKYAGTYRETEYMVGHSLGEALVSRFNELFLEGIDPTEIVANFYTLSERDKLIAILTRFKISLSVYKRQEELEFKAYLQSLSIPWNDEFIYRTSPN